MQDSPLDKLIVGTFLIVVGLLIIILHRSIKERRDWWLSRDWPAGLGDAWTGKYTRGGLIFTYALIIVAGVVLFATGIAWIVSVLTQ